MAETLKRNSEILLLYDALLTNPNGDPDDENKPRYDYDTRRNLVTDVRLKRYLRDYWIHQGKNVFVAKVDEKAVTSTERVADVIKGLELADAKKRLVETFYDIKYFGATVTVKKEKKKKSEQREDDENKREPSIPITGPVQFTWGYSLHPTEVLHSSRITSLLAGRDSEHGTMGQDWRIKYSLIAFYGIISAWRAKETLLTDEDVERFDVDILKALKLMTTTRSKIGQTPRLYMRIEWNDDETFHGDLRDLVKVEVLSQHTPASIDDLKIDLSELGRFVHDPKVNKIKLWIDEEFKAKALGTEKLEGDKVSIISI